MRFFLHVFFFGGFLARGDCPRCEWIIQDFIPTFFFFCDEGKRKNFEPTILRKKKIGVKS